MMPAWSKVPSAPASFGDPELRRNENDVLLRSCNMSFSCQLCMSCSTCRETACASVLRARRGSMSESFAC